jgi:hypothetical protein
MPVRERDLDNPTSEPDWGGCMPIEPGDLEVLTEYRCAPCGATTLLGKRGGTVNCNCPTPRIEPTDTPDVRAAKWAAIDEWRHREYVVTVLRTKHPITFPHTSVRRVTVPQA